MSDHRVKLLGQAIGEFLVAAKVVSATAMTEPMVLAQLEQVTADLRDGKIGLVPLPGSDDSGQDITSRLHRASAQGWDHKELMLDAKATIERLREALPEGMTPEKLRTIAGWLDTYDRLAARYVELINLLHEQGLTHIDGSYEEALRAAAGKEVQDDLRRWADAIEAADSGRDEHA